MKRPIRLTGRVVPLQEAVVSSQVAAVDPGSYVNPGQALAKISRTDIYEVKASLPADAAVKVTTGQRIQFRSRNLGMDSKFAELWQGITNTIRVFQPARYGEGI